jgi:hypothetical protein
MINPFPFEPYYKSKLPEVKEKYITEYEKEIKKLETEIEFKENCILQHIQAVKEYQVLIEILKRGK